MPRKRIDPRQLTFDWDELYRERPVEEMPWFHPELDQDLERALARLEITGGAGLDLGTGPGTQAIALAERGFRMIGTDISQAAIQSAAERARRMGLKVQFRRDDILDTGLAGGFDFIFDRGCFHILPPARRAEYVTAAARLVAPGGHLFLKTFSHLEQRDTGPYRFTSEQIRGIFAPGFDLISAEQTVYQGPLDPRPLALFCVLKPVLQIGDG